MLISSNSPSQILSDFKPKSVICQSNFAVILLSNSNKTSKYVIKLYPHQEDGTLNEFYLREKEFISLSHKNLINIVEFHDKISISSNSKGNELSSLIMEFASFGDLANIIENNFEILEDQTLVRTIFLQILDGVEFLHQNDLAHLDLKPENIVITNDMTFKIIDFDSCVNLKHPRQVSNVGTKNYRAPELRKGCCINCQAADLFSLGVLLFVLLFGTFPFDEDDTSKKLETLFIDSSDKFWDFHPSTCDIEISEDIKELFKIILSEKIDGHKGIEVVKQSKWMSRRKYNATELKQIFQRNEIKPLFV